MYDQAQIVSENISKKTVKAPHENQSGFEIFIKFYMNYLPLKFYIKPCLILSRTEDAGIEMQILARNNMVDPATKNNNNNSNDISQANSVISIEYPAEKITSTIGE